MKCIRLLTALAIATLAVRSASAQANGGLKVRVIDNSDKSAVIGAAVTLSNTNKLVATSTIITDVNGIALFPVLRVGAGYVVTVIMDGYAGIRQDATVSGGTTKELVIALAPEHVERVTVIGEKTQVDLDQNQASTRFSSDFIQDLPVAGRFYQNVLSLAPGVQDPDGDGNPNVNGSRERDFKTTVSGISNQDPLTGLQLSQINSDSIEDLTVVTAGAGAEYGRAQGGFAQIIQKQGSNDFEGVFGLLYSSRALDGNGATNIPNSQLPDFYLYQPSLQISGPIVKDKLWYRLSQEVIRREDPLVLASGGDVGTQGTRQVITDNQLTWQVSNRNKLAFIFRADPLKLTNVGLSAVTPASSTQQYEFGGPTYTLTWTAPYSPSLLVDTTVAYNDSSTSFKPTDPGASNTCVGSSSPLQGLQCFDFLTGTISGAAPVTYDDSRQRVTLKSDATYYKGRLWGASHQFKTGLIIENERFFSNLVQNPTVTRFAGFTNTGGEPAQIYNINASLVPVSQQRAVGTTWGVYGEDTLRPLSNLSIIVGLRIEQENISAPGYEPFDPQAESDSFNEATQGLTSDQKAFFIANEFIAYEALPAALDAVNAQIPGLNLSDSAFTQQLNFWRKFRRPDDINIHNTNIAPRLSVAWDPWNDGKTKFSFSAGRYFDKLFLGNVTPESEPTQVNFSIIADSSNPAFVPTFSYTTIDRNIRTPYTDEFSFLVEREFWQESSISLRYIHKEAKRQLQDTDINQAPGDYGRCYFAQSAGDPSLVPSPGTGTVVDPYTGKSYKDTDPGDGDGRTDDCAGENEFGTPTGGGAGGQGNLILLPRPDGVADLYVLNPGWGSIYQIGNFNSSKYDGVIVEFVRRQYKNWQMQASYTWSKAIGDGEDYRLNLGDDRSTLQDEKGYQSYDIRHSLKVNATAITPWGFRLGGTVQWQSGLPYSILLRRSSTVSAVPGYGFGQPYTSVRTVYPTHQRNDQRNKSYWNFNAKLVKEITLPKGMNLQLTAEIFNLLNEDTYVVYNNFSKSGQQINGTNDAYRRFGRQYQVGMRLAF